MCAPCNQSINPNRCPNTEDGTLNSDFYHIPSESSLTLTPFKNAFKLITFLKLRHVVLTPPLGREIPQKYQSMLNVP